MSSRDSNGDSNSSSGTPAAATRQHSYRLLGIVAAKAEGGDDFLRFVEAWWTGRADPSRGWFQWQVPEFEVRLSGSIPAGVDGEALAFDAPLRFRCLRAPFGCECTPGPANFKSTRPDPSDASCGQGREPTCGRGAAHPSGGVPWSCAYPARWTIARMLPSVSLNHARRSPLASAMPFSVLSLGRSYSSNITPRPRS
jgi:hypothetical protein